MDQKWTKAFHGRTTAGVRSGFRRWAVPDPPSAGSQT